MFSSAHHARVAQIALNIGMRLGLSATQLAHLQLAASVHDIGNLAVPTEILTKPGKLSEVEFALVRTHPAVGRDILQQLEIGAPIAEIVHQHHERIDGSGYPRGLSGPAILLEARILAVADAYDAISTFRPYRAPLAEQFALAQLQQHAGVSLDRSAVHACREYVLQQMQDSGSASEARADEVGT